LEGERNTKGLKISLISPESLFCTQSVSCSALGSITLGWAWPLKHYQLYAKQSAKCQKALQAIYIWLELAVLATLQRYFVHRSCKESSYFKLFGAVYTQSYHGSPHALQLYTLTCPGYIFLGSGLLPLSPLIWQGTDRAFWDEVLW